MKIWTREEFEQEQISTEPFPPELMKQVAEIIREVQINGDQALRHFTEMWDGVRLAQFEIPKEEWEKAYRLLDKSLREAMDRAKKQILSFQESLKPSNQIAAPAEGKILGIMYRPLDRVGVYVPGGKAAYPSTVFMTVLPAKVAGVKEVIMVTPVQKDGTIRKELLAAAWMAGVNRLFAIGGAQAIAALAYGTESIPKVDKIVGPGNIYVAVAKKLVYGDVGIDAIAGPSELAVIADEEANPAYIAADLLAQAEHDEQARTFLITPSRTLAEKVHLEIQNQLQTLPRKNIIEISLRDYHRTILVDGVEEACRLINQIAPEHLSLQVRDAWALVSLIQNAGAIFIGEMTPEALGDYLAGPSHVLPTGGTARFSSGLSVLDFYTRISLLHYGKEAFLKEAELVERFALAEELHGHAASVNIRREDVWK
jgi:histidinol dehydrogenase